MLDPAPRVLHVVLGLQPGGLEQAVVDLARAQTRAGAVCGVCALREEGPLSRGLAAAGIACTREGDAAVSPLGLLRRLIARVREWRPSVLHTHNPGANFYGALAGRLAGIPAIICTRHGEGQSDAAVWFPFLCHRLVAVSEGVRARLLSRWQVPRRRVVTIHNGVDAGRASSLPRAEARARLGLPEGVPVAITVARLAPEKDHLTLLRAAAGLRARLPELHCLLVGGGRLEAGLRQQAERLGLQSSVLFLGQRTDVAELLPAADVFVLPSLQEGLSIAVLEAMSAGLPVVATAVGGNSLLVRDGQTGFLAPPRDADALAKAMEAVLTQPERASQLGAAGRARVQAEFSVEDTARRYLDLYGEVLGMRHRRAPGDP